eukprot:scaffold363942_cov15-Prasinocladus_malaysianus.AAC.1
MSTAAATVDITSALQATLTEPSPHSAQLAVVLQPMAIPSQTVQANNVSTGRNNLQHQTSQAYSKM